MFGENSDTATQHITDGTSNTVAIAEQTHNVIDGAPNAWGYRGWVQIGLDLGFYGINRFDVFLGAWYTGNRDRIMGRLAEWGTTGSLHPGGINITLGDASVRFISESTDRDRAEANLHDFRRRGHQDSELAAFQFVTSAVGTAAGRPEQVRQFRHCQCREHREFLPELRDLFRPTWQEQRGS